MKGPKHEISSDQMKNAANVLLVSNEKIFELLREICSLRADLRSCSLTDFLTFNSIDISELGRELEASDVVRRDVWEAVFTTAQNEGLNGVLDLLEEEASSLQQQNKAFISTVHEMEQAVKSQELGATLEQKQFLDFKADFMKLYSLWHWLQEAFVLSNMLFAELCDRCNVDSLLDRVRVQ